MKLRFRYKVTAALAVFIGAAAFLVSACGSKSKDAPVASAPAPTPTSTPAETPTPTPTPTAAPAEPQAEVWVASNSQRFLVGYTADGTLKKVIDLSRLASAGGITALAFVDRSNLIAFLDPGASGERFVSINVETEVINSAWFMDTTNFSNVSVNKIEKASANALYVQKATGVENLLFDFGKTLVSRVSAATWPILTSANCPITTAQYAIPLKFNNIESVLLLSSGANTRLNVWTATTSVPACAAANSYNYTSSVPTGAAYVPVAALQTPSGKVYVRFQHATTPRIMSFDFDGTTLTNGTDVFSNVAVLTAGTTSREMTLFGEDLLVGDWASNSVHVVGLDGTYKGIFAKDGYTVSVSSIAIRPSE